MQEMYILSEVEKLRTGLDKDPWNITLRRIYADALEDEGRTTEAMFHRLYATRLRLCLDPVTNASTHTETTYEVHKHALSSFSNLAVEKLTNALTKEDRPYFCYCEGCNKAARRFGSRRAAEAAIYCLWVNEGCPLF